MTLETPETGECATDIMICAFPDCSNVSDPAGKDYIVHGLTVGRLCLSCSADVDDMAANLIDLTELDSYRQTMEDTRDEVLYDSWLERDPVTREVP